MSSFLSKKWLKLFPLLFLIFSFTTCDFDKGLGPLQNKIEGKIFYLTPEMRPANVGEVRVAALLQFPPSGLGDIFFSEPVEFRKDTVNYEIFLPPGDYVGVAILWKPRGENWSFNSLLGIYGFEPPTRFEMLPVPVKEEDAVVSDINISAIWNFANTDSKVNGRITYKGVPPKDTQTVLLAAFSQVPNFDNLLLSLLFLGGLPLPVSISESTFTYQLRVYHGEYKFIGLLWKGVDTPLDKVKLIGFYPAPGQPDKPGSFSLPENGSVYNIDLSGDFGSLPDGIRPGK